ncbi:MAG: TlpA family protein disulfide reductase [Anaerolineae bacterium]
MTENIQTAPDKEMSESQATGVNWISVGIWTAVLGLLAVLGWGLINSSKTRPEPGQAAPEFKMTFFEEYEWQNQPVANLNDLRGKVVVLNFWASWCVECRTEQTLLENTWKAYKDQDVVFVGITYADVEPNARQWLKDYEVTYPNAPDLGTLISADYEITGVPETFFIGKDGVIEHVEIGPVDDFTLTSIIDRLLTRGG